MATLARKTQYLFAAAASDIGQFGSGQLGTKVISTDPAVLMDVSGGAAGTAWNGGWLDAVLGANKFPPLEEMNCLAYIDTYQLTYLFQEGIPEYDAATTYSQFGICKQAGTFNIYGSIIANNVNNALSDGSAWELLVNLASIQGSRRALTGNATYYVSNSGNDSTGNGTSGNPWATFQHARNYVSQNIDAAGFSVTYQFQGSGPYLSNTTCNISLVPANTPEIFDGASQTISTTSADCFTINGGGLNATFQNMKLQTTTSGNGVAYANGAHISFGAGINFGAIANEQVSGTLGGTGQFVTGSSCTISGGGTNHIAIDLGARFFENSVTKTLSGTPAFSNGFVSIQDCASMQSTSMTYSGGGTGSQYIIQANGSLNTNGATTNWPTGLSMGSTPSGGQII